MEMCAETMLQNFNRKTILIGIQRPSINQLKLKLPNGKMDQIVDVHIFMLSTLEYMPEKVLRSQERVTSFVRLKYTFNYNNHRQSILNLASSSRNYIG